MKIFKNQFKFLLTVDSRPERRKKQAGELKKFRIWLESKLGSPVDVYIEDHITLIGFVERHRFCGNVESELRNPTVPNCSRDCAFSSILWKTSDASANRDPILRIFISQLRFIMPGLSLLSFGVRFCTAKLGQNCSAWSRRTGPSSARRMRTQAQQCPFDRSEDTELESCMDWPRYDMSMIWQSLPDVPQGHMQRHSWATPSLAFGLGVQVPPFQHGALRHTSSPGENGWSQRRPFTFCVIVFFFLETIAYSFIIFYGLLKTK